MTLLIRTLVFLMTFACFTHANIAWAQQDRREELIRITNLIHEQECRKFLNKEVHPIAIRNGYVSMIYLDKVTSTFYRPDVNELNELLADFSKLKSDKHTLILLPGLGRQVYDELNSVEFQSRLRFPMNREERIPEKRLVTDLTIYIPTARYQGKFDEKVAARWIADLDSDDFKTREAAQDALQPIAQAAKWMLRDALSKSSSAEQRSRINQLLKPLKGFDVMDLKLPKNVQLLDADDLVSQYQKEIEKARNRQFKNGETESEREWAHIKITLSEMASLHRCHSDVIPYLTKLLDKGRRRCIRICAAEVLGDIGAEAVAAIPTLKVIDKNKEEVDEDVRRACHKAINQIYGALKPNFTEVMKKQYVDIKKDIKELKQNSKNQ